MNEQTIQLGHGGGGLMSRELIQSEIVTRFGGGALKGLPDGATLPMPVGRSLVFTTDSFVVHPLEFPGGNIGDLAVHGTVNDLAVCGAVPRWLSLALIMEEGLPLTTLRRVLDSVKRAADDCGVAVVTGDTKVVARGQCDGLYINTSGIGEKMDEFDLGAGRVSQGDHILVSGSVGDHGMAVLAAREGIRITHGVMSDTGPVHRLVQASRPFARDVKWMRDPTRGGLASVLNEVVEDQAVGIMLDEAAIPFSAGAKGVAEMLGVDLLQVASEGRMIMIVAASASEAVLSAWRSLPEGRDAARIGVVTDRKGRVILETLTGGHRLVDVPRGELLPRIC